MKRLLFFVLLPLVLLAQDHLLISEVMIPSSTETGKAFVEIYNPTANSVELNSLYLANYNTYYNMVNGVYPTTATYFLAKFPSGQISSKQTITVALDGQAFRSAFAKAADFEIKSTDASIPDMEDVTTGGNPQLEFIRGMVILFNWNGQSDLIQDIDYFPWGLSVFSSSWMDKSGIRIDGPDAGSDSSAYLNDEAVSLQKAWQVPSGGQSLQREGIDEIDEIQSGGNGITGHNEATENWKLSFAPGLPSPGLFSETPGDGTGLVTVTPDTLEVGQTADLVFTLTGTGSHAARKIKINIPDAWQWTAGSDKVELLGSAFSGATLSINGKELIIDQAQVSSAQTDTIIIKNLTAPEQKGAYVFKFYTAADGGTLTPIGLSPTVSIIKSLTIAEIRNNLDDFEGKKVTIKAVVSIGVNITRTDRCDAYVQDFSGRGINLNDGSTNFPLLKRGNYLKITGTVSIYTNNKNGDVTVQIKNFKLDSLAGNQPIPAIPKLSTEAAGNLNLEGTMIEANGIINDKIEGLGGGSNLTINDGTGNLALRIWDSSNLDLSDYAIGDTIGVRGVVGSFKLSPQILVGYQKDLFHVRFNGSPTFLKVENKPFAPDQGEKISIRFGVGIPNSHITLRIFDLAGRVVTTILDGVGMPFPMGKAWDGRNQIGQNIPVGTYICHLEVVNTDTGKRTVKIAPIVVGTMLR